MLQIEKAIWKGKEIFAFEISQDYNDEKIIRQASGRKELLCPDENCKNRILKYCHGEKKQPYFAHVVNTDCGYEKYDNETTEYTKAIKRLLYSHLKKHGYDVKMDVKLVDKHYSHLVVIENGVSYPIEIFTKFSSANRLDTIKRKYDEKQIKSNWIVTDINPNDDDSVVESELSFAKRFSLNETDDNSLITIDLTGNSVVQYCMDTNTYTFDGIEISSKNYPNIFKFTSDLSNIEFSDGKLQVSGFKEAFNGFLIKKKRAFDKKLLQLKEQKEKNRIEAQKAFEEAQRFANLIKEKRLQEEQEREKIRQEQEKEKQKKRKKKRVTLQKPKEHSLEEIFISLSETKLMPYNPDSKDQMLKWDKSKFEQSFEKIIMEPSTEFKMIVQKLRYGTQTERMIFKQLYDERNKYDARIVAVLAMIYTKVIDDIGNF